MICLLFLLVKPTKIVVCVFFILEIEFSDNYWENYGYILVKFFYFFHVLANFVLAFETELLLRPNIGAS